MRTETEVRERLVSSFEPKTYSSVSSPQSKAFADGLEDGIRMTLLWVLGVDAKEIPDAVAKLKATAVTE